MSTYETLRHFADSWALIMMFGIFLAFCLWPFRPGAGERNRDAATLIFRDQNDGNQNDGE